MSILCSTRGVIASVLASALVSLVPARPAQATDINGAGSTFVHPVMLGWAAAYNAKTGVKVGYLAIGSGGGIREIKAGRGAFGASDKPLPPEELRAAGLAQFPLVIGGVVPVVNIDGIRPGQLNFTGELLADIYLGKVTRWNDAAITALNPDLKLPELKIQVVHRADSSGTTFNWVNYLSKASPEWKSGVGDGTTVKWPTGIAGNGNEGVARYVDYLKGAIGYVELSYALRRNMAFGKVRNKAGAFVAPTMDSFQAAAAGAGWEAPDFYELLTDAPGNEAWPIAATVFVLMPRRPTDYSGSTEALRFFRWVLEHGQSEARKLNYVALPEPLVKRVEAYWQANIK
jgi:phosphate transport system substrate-binding protein